MTMLDEFRDGFARALLAPGTTGGLPPAVARLAAQPGFAVYRNTVIKGCVDALEANFPAVLRLVGREWLRAAAASYAREHLPAHPMLLDYGSCFPDFLAAFEPASDLPWLPAVACLDRLWVEAHGAADAAAIAGTALSDIATDTLAQFSLVPHTAARWAWFEAAPAYTIWSRNRSGPDGDRPGSEAAGSGAPPEHGMALDGPLVWQPEGVLLTRPDLTVRHCGIGRGAAAFLDACAAAGTLEAAALAALEAEPELDLATVVPALIAAGAFAAVRRTADPDAHPPPTEDTIE